MLHFKILYVHLNIYLIVCQYKNALASHTQYHNTVIAQSDEIFLLFHAISAILGHGSPEKPESRRDAC